MRTPTATIGEIQAAICAFSEITLAQLRGPRRSVALSLARMIGMYLAREEAQMSFPRIGTWFGGRDHTTAMHAHRAIHERMKTDGDLKRAVDEVRSLLGLPEAERSAA